MIRINLLNERQAPAMHVPRGLGKILVVAAIAVAAAAAGGALWTFRASLLPKPGPREKQEITVNAAAAPSTFAKSGMLEDVVKEVSDVGQKISADGILRLPYNELSFTEKIDYEVLFAKEIVELLGKAVPAGIGLRELDADNFQTVYAVGLAPSRELVESVFSTLKANDVTLLPRRSPRLRRTDATASASLLRERWSSGSVSPIRWSLRRRPPTPPWLKRCWRLQKRRTRILSPLLSRRSGCRARKWALTSGISTSGREAAPTRILQSLLCTCTGPGSLSPSSASRCTR